MMCERGSDDGRMSCTPWQEAQLATVWLPERLARPWKLSSKAATAVAFMPNFSVSRRSPWQRPQVIFGTFEAKTGEPLSAGPRIRCSPWQSVQTGASAMPLAAALPCTLTS